MLDYLSFFSVSTWTLLLSSLSLLLVYGYWPYGFFKKLGVPGPKPTLFFGNTLNYFKGIHTFDQECYNKYGKIWGIFEGRLPLLNIMDTELIKTVLVKECYSYFTNRRDFGLNGEMYDSVFVLEDEEWKRIRSVLSPSFTSGRLKEMFGIMKTRSRNLMNNFKRDADKGKSTIPKEYFGAYSMDVVGSTAFSVDINSLNNPNDPFVANVKKLVDFSLTDPLFIILGFFPFLEPVLSKMGVSVFPKSVMEFFYSSLQNIKSERKAGSYEKRVDFLQLMIESQKETENGEFKGISDHEILSQSMIFIFAGYETSSTTLNFISYNLATNPEAMRKLQQEIDHVFPDKAEVQYEPLMQMEYLDCVINETLRLFPPAPRLDRVCKKSVEINGVIIPKGTIVQVPIYILHRDPELWTDPDCFKPERFSKENKASVDPYSFMPFGLGPRNCIGMRFALVSIKLAVVELLQRYDIVTCAATEIPVEVATTGFTSPKRPIQLKFVPRSHGSSQTNPRG